jgi:capsid protein
MKIIRKDPLNEAREAAMRIQSHTPTREEMCKKMGKDR